MRSRSKNFAWGGSTPPSGTRGGVTPHSTQQQHGSLWGGSTPPSSKMHFKLGGACAGRLGSRGWNNTVPRLSALQQQHKLLAWGGLPPPAAARCSEGSPPPDAAAATEIELGGSTRLRNSRLHGGVDPPQGSSRTWLDQDRQGLAGLGFLLGQYSSGFATPGFAWLWQYWPCKTSLRQVRPAMGWLGLAIPAWTNFPY